MHPVLFHLGRFPVPTYGIIAVVALLVAMLVVRRFAAREGLDPGRSMDAIVLTLAAGVLGARVLDVLINWETMFGEPQRIKTMVFSTGTYLGGLITALIVGFFWFRRIKMPLLQGLDLIGLVAALIMGIGRWGCFSSGCCYGKPTDVAWAVTFPEAARQLHAGLPAVPIHPTQIYLSLNSLVIFGILVLAYRWKRFHGQIISIYLVLYGLTRYPLELFRADPERGFVLGGLLSTSQFLSVFLVLGGVTLYVLLARRHRQSQQADS